MGDKNTEQDYTQIDFLEIIEDYLDNTGGFHFQLKDGEVEDRFLDVDEDTIFIGGC